jgi:hypothetical protein
LDELPAAAVEEFARFPNDDRLKPLLEKLVPEDVVRCPYQIPADPLVTTSKAIPKTAVYLLVHL